MKIHHKPQETWSEEKNRMAEWKKQFCWIPKRVDDSTSIWLDFVESRAYWDGWMGRWEYEYREFKDEKL